MSAHCSDQRTPATFVSAWICSQASRHPCWRSSFAISPRTRTRRFACGRWGLLRNRVTSRAAAEATSLARDLSRSDDPADRRAAAAAFAWRGAVDVDRAVLASLLDDPDLTVRAAALDAVSPRRRHRFGDRSPRRRGRQSGPPCRPSDRGSRATRRSRGRAPRRRGRPRRRAPARVARPGRGSHGPGPRGLDRPTGARRRATASWCSQHSTRSTRHGAATFSSRACWSALLLDSTALAERAFAARAALADRDASLVRALDDEIDLARRLVIAVLALRHGDRIRAAVRVVDREEGARRALAVEALDVVLSRHEAAIALPLVSRDLTLEERAAGSRRADWPAHRPEEWIADIAGDPEGVWRSPWLTACALHATER